MMVLGAYLKDGVTGRVVEKVGHAGPANDAIYKVQWDLPASFEKEGWKSFGIAADKVESAVAELGLGKEHLKKPEKQALLDKLKVEIHYQDLRKIDLVPKGPGGFVPTTTQTAVAWTVSTTVMLGIAGYMWYTYKTQEPHEE